MTNKEIFQDNPEHKAGNTSSIGGLWPPEASSFRRTKGIFNLGVITSMQEVKNVEDVFMQHSLRLSNSRFVDTKNIPPTRIQFRALIDGGLLRNLPSGVLRDSVEAIIPLDGGKFGLEPVFVYFSKNSDIRCPEPKDINTVYRNVSEALEVGRRPFAEIAGRLHTNGYQIEILKDRGESDVLQLADLYKRFGWGIEDVRKIVSDKNNVFCVVRHEGLIVSSGIAESVSVSFGSTNLNIVEITEAATVDEHGGKGLYTAVSALLLAYLARASKQGILNDEIDLVFGECNGLSLPVLKAAKIQGRTFSTEVGSIYGYPESGILRQQVPIQGPPKVTEFNDLVPAFLTRTTLYDYYYN